MKIITRSEIDKKFSNNLYHSPFFSIRKNGFISISKQGCKLLNLQKADRILFAEDDGKMFIFKSKEEEGGYVLNSSQNGYNLNFTSPSLSNMLIDRYKLERDKRYLFLISETSVEERFYEIKLREENKK